MSAPGPSAPDVFLSYAREDEARARELASALQREGLAVFWDREVPPGQTWHSYIGQGLASARCVVVAWSSHSVASQWVIEEASEGKDRHALVPVLFEAVQPPFGFRAIQAASLIDWRPGRPSPAFEGLLGAVRRIVGGRTAPGSEAPSPDQRRPDERSPEPGRRPPRQTDQRSYRTLALTAAAIIAIVGAVGTGIYWWRTQPAQTSKTPGSEHVAQAQPSSSERALSKIASAPSPVTAPATLAPAETPRSSDEIRDCEQCPVMIMVPAGKFTMGSPPNEAGRDDNEGPQHSVTIAHALAVGKYEVTFAEWDACVASGGCSSKPSDQGWGRGSQPVINVSWNDAQDYVKWLTKETRKDYRLLSEAEWEYVARAGSATAYWWGDEVGRGNADCDGCGSPWDRRQSAPVGRFAANRFGLYDTAGNVWEWVADCYHETYDEAPQDGSAWENGHDCQRVLRGGSWNYGPSDMRSANRSWDGPDFRYVGYGLRVARAPD